ncbi:acidic leucine-rich nuclear phosphoprotein 32 family member E [Rhagoletis pomonella]|uniref:acidic leucine-rich nuclear phosphoprotein 32 family member E n=1 Tax=Rhagoletis pomonella TaxID=28610 RepID=UPI00177EE18D|nr:acidic leucine-rich nuclear phosphoprotein 32 family member E [Rhagoletis pomonella]
MCTIYSILILAAVSLPALVTAEGISVERQDEAVTLPVPTTPKPLCEEKICPRLYWPVCSLVDGQQMTASSPCVLNNKIRCSKLLRQSMGRKVPTIRFLHAGPCSAQRDRSNVVRMRDAADVVGNEKSSKEASFEEIIDEMIDEILYGDSGESDEYDEEIGSDEYDDDIGSDEDDEDIGSDEDDEDIGSDEYGILSGENFESDEDSDEIIDRILSGESTESDEDRDEIIDGILESVENSGAATGEEIDNDYDEAEPVEDKGEILHRRRQAKIDKSWL